MTQEGQLIGYRRADGRAEIQRPVQAAVIVEPARGDNVLGQGPVKQDVFVFQSHIIYLSLQSR